MIKDHAGFESLYVRLHLLPSTGVLASRGSPRPIFDLGCGRQLTALLQTRNDNRIEVGARRVNGGGIARRP